MYLSPVPEHSGSGLGPLIPIPDCFWHRNFVQSDILKFKKGYTLHICTADGRKGHTPARFYCWQWKEATLNVYTAGSWKRILPALPYRWRWKGIHPAHCTSILLAVEMVTPYTSILFAVVRGTSCTSILMLVERDTPCMSILLAVEMDTPCTSILMLVERDTPCMSILLAVEMDTPCTSILKVVEMDTTLYVSGGGGGKRYTIHVQMAGCKN
jgi:hypothetical protein